MRTIIIDNYDSFTFNLHHYLEAELNDTVTVVRNDKISIEQIGLFDQIVLSPGPGLPKDAGITMEVLKLFGEKKRILGVCLGHQAIGLAFGGRLANLATVYHGVSSNLRIIKDDYLWRDIPNESPAGRYHSWVISREQLPDCLEVTAEDEHGEIMAIRHKTYDIRGVQFHPESIMSTHGRLLIRNWVREKQTT